MCPYCRATSTHTADEDRYLGFILVDGGTPLLFWGFIACAIGQTAVYASLSGWSSPKYATQAQPFR